MHYIGKKNLEFDQFCGRNFLLSYILQKRCHILWPGSPTQPIGSTQNPYSAMRSNIDVVTVLERLLN